MRKKYYKNLKLIVCVGKDNLIGDRTPDEDSNGMLWHIKEELIYFYFCRLKCFSIDLLY